MKIKLRELREVIRQVINETKEELTMWGDFKVGDVVAKPRRWGGFDVREIIGLYSQISAWGTPMVIVKTRSYTDQGISGLPAEEFLGSDTKLATPQQIKNAMEAGKRERERMAREIDTSKEGT